MINMQVQSSSVEENFVFGSPPLLNGFSYNTCRAQEGAVKSTNTSAPQDCFLPNFGRAVDETVDPNIMSYCQKYPTQYGPRSNQSYKGFPLNTAGTSVLDNLNQLYLNNNGRNGLKFLEQAGLKAQKLNEQPVFKKRKDLRVLKSVLSTERFRKVTMMFGDGDEGGREIVESVHKAMRKAKRSTVSCLFCNTDSQVYENFPIVDGTLFLSPKKLSKNCVPFEDHMNGITNERQMCFICVGCLEGKPSRLECLSCLSAWNGSFFQVGTLYSYNILSAIPCCDRKVQCNNCSRTLINLRNGEASTLYFSYFSSKTTCPDCHVEDFHFVKPLQSLHRK